MLRELFFNHTYTISLVICLLIVAISKIIFEKRFQDFMLLFFNFRYLKLYIKEHKFFSFFESLLFVNLIIGVSIFIHVFYSKNNTVTNTTTFLLKIALAVSFFIIIKMFIQQLLSNILEINTIIVEYLFVKKSYLNFLGLLLIPTNAFLIYNLRPETTTIISIGIIFITIHLLGVFLFFKNNLKLIKTHFFYFILYLCALEISPYVILYKSFT